jgi:hypothetical protein
MRHRIAAASFAASLWGVCAQRCTRTPRNPFIHAARRLILSPASWLEAVVGSAEDNRRWPLIADPDRDSRRTGQWEQDSARAPFALAGVAVFWFAVVSATDWYELRIRVPWARASANLPPPETSTLTAGWIGFAGVVLTAAAAIIVALIDWLAGTERALQHVDTDVSLAVSKFGKGDASDPGQAPHAQRRRINRDDLTSGRPVGGRPHGEIRLPTLRYIAETDSVS